MVLNLGEYPHAKKAGRAPIAAKMETVEIDKILVNDRSFCVSYPLEDAHLFASVARFGVLVPLSLLRRDNPVVVTGFKRLDAARRLGIEELPCVFLDISERQALLTAIHDNITRPLNTVEKALCIDKMLAAGFEVKEVYEVMTILGLPPRQNVLKTATSAAWAEEQAKSFIVKHQLPLTLVEQLFSFDAEERHSIIRLADAVHGTVSSLREMLHLMMLLKVKRGAVDFEQLDGAKDADAIRQRLKRQTNPLLSDLEEKLGRLLCAAALPPSIKVRVDPAFEKESIDISLRAGSSREIEEALKKLECLTGQGLFRSIFELTHGTPHRL
jgi:ParB-like chromosome segregation protein Spo0J